MSIVERASPPNTLPTTLSDLTTNPPKSGVSQLAFNPSATHLMVRLDTQPNVLHTCAFLPSPGSSSPDIRHLASVIFDQGIRAAKWEGIGDTDLDGMPGIGEEKGKRKERLVVTTRVGGLFFWDGAEDGVWEEEGETSGSVGNGGMMEAVGVPTQTDYIAHDIAWSPDTSCLAIMDKVKHQFCMLYEDMRNERDGSNGQAEIPQEGLSFVVEEEEEEDDQQGFMAGFRAGGGVLEGYRGAAVTA